MIRMMHVSHSPHDPFEVIGPLTRDFESLALTNRVTGPSFGQSE